MALPRMLARVVSGLQCLSRCHTHALSPAVPGRFRTLSSDRRWQHTAPQSTSCNWQLREDCFELNYGGLVMHFDYVWLRDHCRSASCYNAKTNQRSLDTANVELNIRPAKTRVEGETLFLTWPDGHVTRYGLAWLVENSYEGRRRRSVQPRILWNSGIYGGAQVPHARWDRFMSCDEELRKFLSSFLLYGIAFVDDVPATAEATETVTQRVSIIRETIYGRVWSFTSDFSRGDTAYTKLALDCHTDTSYFQEPCGIQVFHCLQGDTSMGDCCKGVCVG
ncbi:hypothetical protein COCON_G00085300 [Conger conger]|uniref:trimethyllysine dioxygenase n=1 Tax=Conger conger TaxID=82655 RepID=A0A9Q1DQE3_CONCO|nr:hypothetical protein COCON_G00085300 [Conger conger]